MNLNDRLDAALSRRKLAARTPRVSLDDTLVVTRDTLSTATVESEAEHTTASGVATKEVPVTSVAYDNIQVALLDINHHQPDEFGTISVMVKNIEYAQLPFRLDRYIIDDVQQRPNGDFEVHITLA